MKTKFVVGAIIFWSLIILIVFFGVGGFSIVGVSNYGIFDDFNSGLDKNKWRVASDVAKSGDVFLSPEFTDGFLKFPSGGDGVGTAGGPIFISAVETVEPFVDTELRVVVDNQALIGSGLYLYDENRSLLCNVGESSRHVVYEVKLSDLSDAGVVLVNGLEKCEFNAEIYHVRLVGSSRLRSMRGFAKVDEVLFKKRFTTRIDADTEAFYQKKFVGPQNIGIPLGSFKPSVKSFSLDNPIDILSSSRGSVSSSAEPLVLLSNFSVVHVPLGETWQVQWVGERDSRLVKECFVFDADTFDCATQIQFVSQVSESEVLLDNETIVTSIEYVCGENGGVYSDGVCTLAFDERLSCENLGGVWRDNDCVLDFDAEEECLKAGGVFDSDVCTFVKPSSVDFSGVDRVLLFVGVYLFGLLVIGLVGFWLRKKKR